MLDLLAVWIGVGLGIKLYGGMSMTDTQKEEAVVETKEKETHSWFPESQVAVFGTHLISDKLLNIIRWIMKTEDEHGINSIVISKNMPKAKTLDEQGEWNGGWHNVLGDFTFENKTILINLAGHLEMALDKIMNQVSMMRIGPTVTMGILITIYHEIYHSHRYADADNPYTLNSEEDDSDAEQWAVSRITELAQTINVEATDIDLESKFIASAIDEFEEEALESDEEWAKAYRTLIDKGLIFMDENEEVPTMRGFFKRFAEGGGAPVTGWDEETYTITADMFSQDTPVVHPEAGVLSPTAVDGVEIDYDDPMDMVDYGDDAAAAVAGNMMANMMGGMAAGTTQPVATPGVTMPTLPAQPAAMMTTPPPMSAPAQPTVVAQPAAAPTAGQVTLPVYNLSPEQQTQFITGLCTTMYNHIFGNCGFQPNSDQGFNNPIAIYTFIDISMIPYAKESITHVRTKNEQGQEVTVDIWNPEIAGWPVGHIRGILWDKGQFTTAFPLPGYDIRVNMAGVSEKRSFVPQNCNKSNANGLTKWAQEARQGIMRAMLLDDKMEPNKKIRIIVVDGTITFKPFG